MQRFAGSRAAHAIVGQPRSTVDPLAWVRSGAVVIVNTAKGSVGEDTAALVGTTLLNLVALAVGEQAALDPAERRPVTRSDEPGRTTVADASVVLNYLGLGRLDLLTGLPRRTVLTPEVNQAAKRNRAPLVAALAAGEIMIESPPLAPEAAALFAQLAQRLSPADASGASRSPRCLVPTWRWTIG